MKLITVKNKCQDLAINPEAIVWFGKDFDNGLIVRTKSDKFIFSVENPDETIEGLKKFCTGPNSDEDYHLEITDDPITIIPR